jgi:nucleoside 2-deoxyribosyltransferase
MKITICGSIKNADKLVEIYEKLEKLGHQPMMHENMFAIGRGELDEVKDGIEHAEVKRKNNYIKWWHDLIVSGDAILACNFDRKEIKNYVGGNTLMEIGFAHVSGKKVFLLNPIPEDVSYADEIKAMVDVVVDGDFSKIK